MEYSGLVLKLCLTGLGGLVPLQGRIILSLAILHGGNFSLGLCRVAFSIFTESPHLKPHLTASCQRFLFFILVPSYDQDTETEQKRLSRWKL